MVIVILLREEKADEKEYEGLMHEREREREIQTLMVIVILSRKVLREEKALRHVCFHRMCRRQVNTSAVLACYAQRYFSIQAVNSRACLSALQHDIYWCNSTITSCFRRGDVETARRLFDEMPQRNLVTWNCMISGYVRNHRVAEAHKIFDIMPMRNVVSWTALLTGYARSGRLEESRELFDRMPERNVVCWNSMVSGYIKNGRIVVARQLFEKMPVRNFISWAIMIGGYLQHELVKEAQELFNCAPVQTTSLYNALLVGYVELGYPLDACQLFEIMPERDIASWTTMITCYSQCGKIEIARSLFEEMPQRDIAAWTAIIRGYLKHGELNTALQLFNRMPQRDIIAWNSMISGYIQNGMLQDALQLFVQMPTRDIVSWNSILQGYVQRHDMVNACNLFEKMPQKDETSWNTLIYGYQSEESLDLFSRMIREGFKPDQATLAIVVSVCANLAVLGWGKTIHLCAIRVGYEHDTTILSSLITMYSKCGLIVDATQVFDRMSKRDTISWNAMIAAHAYSGSSMKALELFSAMTQQGFEPDHVTFLGLLSACAHGGLIDEGWLYFNSMKKDWVLMPKPEHYACMVDLLGRSGLLSEAVEFIKEIPTNLSTNTWETLLSACRVHGNLKLGELVAEKVLSFQPSNDGVYVLLANMYASKGMWKDASRIRVLMKECGIKKQYGCSWIEIKGRMHAFVYNDQSHPQTEAIYTCLNITNIIKEEFGHCH